MVLGSLSVSSVLPQCPVMLAKGGAPTRGGGAEAVGPTTPHQLCTGHAALHASDAGLLLLVVKAHQWLPGWELLPLLVKVPARPAFFPRAVFAAENRKGCGMGTRLSAVGRDLDVPPAPF